MIARVLLPLDGENVDMSRYDENKGGKEKHIHLFLFKKTSC